MDLSFIKAKMERLYIENHELRVAARALAHELSRHGVRYNIDEKTFSVIWKDDARDESVYDGLRSIEEWLKAIEKAMADVAMVAYAHVTLDEMDGNSTEGLAAEVLAHKKSSVDAAEEILRKGSDGPKSRN